MLFTGLGSLIWLKTESNGIFIAGLLLAVFGIYVIIASLVPYKKTTEEISDEILGRVLIELPIRLIIRSLGKLGDLF